MLLKTELGRLLSPGFMYFYFFFILTVFLRDIKIGSFGAHSLDGLIATVKKSNYQPVNSIER